MNRGLTFPCAFLRCCDSHSERSNQNAEHSGSSRQISSEEHANEDGRKVPGREPTRKDSACDPGHVRRGGCSFRACCAVSFASAVLAVLFSNLWATESGRAHHVLRPASTTPTNSALAESRTGTGDASLNSVLDSISALRRSDQSLRHGSEYMGKGRVSAQLSEIQGLLSSLSVEEGAPAGDDNTTSAANQESRQWVLEVEKALKHMESNDPGHSVRQGRTCTKQADCLPGKNLVCVRPRGSRVGTCRCPVMSSGNSVCTQRPASMPRWCVLHMDDKLLSGVAMLKDKESFDSMALKTPRMLSRPGKDLAQKADWSRCAVVASSAALSRTLYGEEIDSHTAVIRFNDAPTKGFERQVGSKTTLRVQNVERCGYAERREMCLQYSKTHVCRNQGTGSTGGKGSCTWISPSQRLLDYVQLYWSISKPPGGRKSDLRKLSAGFLGVTLALHLCGTVDLYGFQSGPDHYYKRHEEKKTPFSERHSWDKERKCWSLLRGQKELQRLIRFH